MFGLEKYLIWKNIWFGKLWLLSINGTDVRHCKISQASDLIKVSFFAKIFSLKNYLIWKLIGLEIIWFGKFSIWKKYLVWKNMWFGKIFGWQNI
jgi:hypothetical protein